MTAIFLQRLKMLRPRPALILSIILLVALGIRLWGIGFDLPNLYHPDEDAVIMPALTMLKTGDLEPSRLEYGSLQIYVLVGVFTAVYLYLARQGLIGDPGQLPIFERGSYPMIYPFPHFYLAARLVSVLAGVAIVLLTYMLVQRLSNQRLALLAAAVTAVTPMLVDNAHYATPDTLLTLMVTLSLYLLVRAYDNWHTDNMWAYLGAAFVCGLATSTKYNGAVLLVPLLLVPLFRAKSLDEWLSLRILGAPLVFLLGFLAATPYALLNIPLFLHWAGYALRLYNMPDQVTLVPSWQWHLNYLTTSREAPVFVSGAIGFFYSLPRWGKRGLLLSGFAVAFMLAIIGQTNRQARMWLPLAPIFAAWAALMVHIAAAYVKQHQTSVNSASLPEKPRWLSNLQNNALMLLAALLIAPAFFLSARATYSLGQPDVRTRTARWIETHIPPNTPIALDYFPPNVDPETWPVTQTFRHSDHDLAWYQERGIRYLFFSQGLYARDRLLTNLPRYEHLLAELCHVDTILGPFLSNPGFHMRVYQVPPCS